jgi:hypothetical protein
VAKAIKTSSMTRAAKEEAKVARAARASAHKLSLPVSFLSLSLPNDATDLVFPSPRAVFSKVAVN